MTGIKVYEEGDFRFEFLPQGGTHGGGLVTRFPEMPPYAAEVNLAKIRSRAGYAGDAADTWGLEEGSELVKELKAALNALCVRRSEEVAAKEAESREPETDAPQVDEEKVRELVGRPGVLERMVEAAAAFSKVVGERQLLKLLFLVFVSAQLRLLPGGKPLGANCILSADAGRGKNYIADAVARLLPGEFCFSFENSSPKSLYYKAKSEGPGCLKHRVIYPNEAEAVDPLVETFRPVLSGGQAKLVTVDKNPSGENVEREYLLEGPMVLIVPTVRNKLDAQLQSRMLVVGLDDYPGRVAAHSGAVSGQLDAEYAGEDHAQEILAWQAALRTLTGVRRVVVPVAHEGFRFASDEVPHGARLWTNFLGLMCAHALLEQRNREVRTLADGDKAVVASPEDYAAAYEVFKETCSRSIQNLSEVHRKILGAVHDLQGDDPFADGFTQRKIAEKAKVSQSTVAAHKTYLTRSANLLREVEGAGLRLVADAQPSWWEKGDLLVGFPLPSDVRRWWTRTPAPFPSGPAEVPDREARGGDRHAADNHNGSDTGKSDQGGHRIGVIGGFGDVEEKMIANNENGEEGERTAVTGQKMGILEFGPGGSKRFGLDNLHLEHPVLGAILWSGLSYPWEGSMGELLEFLNANVEDRVRRLPEWPESAWELYMYFASREGRLFNLLGGEVEMQVQTWTVDSERAEEIMALIEWYFPDEYEDGDPDEEAAPPGLFSFEQDNAGGTDEG